MTPGRLRRAILIAFVAVATVAIHYQVKVRLHTGLATASARPTLVAPAREP